MSDRHGMRKLAELLAPELQIVSASEPEPVLRSYNVVGWFDNQDEARNAVLAIEDLAPLGAEVGLVALAGPRASDTGSDAARGGHPTASGVAEVPEDTEIVADVGRRTLKGAVIGAVVGALLIGGVSAFFGQPIGGAVGGAVFGAAIGGIWGAFARMGGSDAYRQSFVPLETDLVMVTFHSNDAKQADEAQARLALQSAKPPVMVNSSDGRLSFDSDDHRSH